MNFILLTQIFSRLRVVRGWAKHTKSPVSPVPLSNVCTRSKPYESGGCVKIGEASPYIGLCGCSREQPYRVNALIVKSVGMLHGASAEYTSLSMNVQHINKFRLHQFLIQPSCLVLPLTFLSSCFPCAPVQRHTNRGVLMPKNNPVFVTEKEFISNFVSK